MEYMPLFYSDILQKKSLETIEIIPNSGEFNDFIQIISDVENISELITMNTGYSSALSKICDEIKVNEPIPKKLLFNGGGKIFLLLSEDELISKKLLIKFFMNYVMTNFYLKWCPRVISWDYALSQKIMVLSREEDVVDSFIESGISKEHSKLTSSAIDKESYNRLYVFQNISKLFSSLKKSYNLPEIIFVMKNSKLIKFPSNFSAHSHFLTAINVRQSSTYEGKVVVFLGFEQKPFDVIDIRKRLGIKGISLVHYGMELDGNFMEFCQTLIEGIYTRFPFINFMANDITSPIFIEDFNGKIKGKMEKENTEKDLIKSVMMTRSLSVINFDEYCMKIDGTTFGGGKEEITCNICLEIIEDEYYCYFGCCGGIYHEECIQKMMKARESKLFCPICRKEKRKYILEKLTEREEREKIREKR
jgi:hypothetical protein